MVAQPTDTATRAATRARVGTGASSGIDQASIRQVTAHSDMLAIVSEVVELKRAGTSHRGLCPFHAEKTPSFHVNAALKVYHCKGCGAGGDLISFVRETRGMGFVEAVQWLADRAGVELVRQDLDPHERARRDSERSQRARLIELATVAQQFFRSRFSSPDGRAAADYASKRGLGPAIAVRYGLGAVGGGWSDLCDHLRRLGWADRDIVAMGLGIERPSGGLYDRFRNRLMFPIFSAQGDLVAFGGRDLSGDSQTAKYLNSPEVVDLERETSSPFHHFYKKGDVVFGLYQAREAIRKSGTAILVEGNLDVMTLAQAGFENTVCAMGTALTDVQARTIRRFAPQVVVLYDGDRAGRAAAHKAVPMLLAEGCNGVLVALPDGEDPDSFVRTQGAEALRQRIAEALPMLNAHLDALVAAWDGSLQGKSAILQAAGPLLALIGNHDAMARNMAYDYLAARLEPDAPLDLNRADQRRYLHRPIAIAPAPAPGRAADVAEGPAAAESELLQLLVWYPAELGQPALRDAVDFVAHPGTRLALRDLLALHRDHGLDLDAVARWAIDYADAELRGRVLTWLAEPAPAPAAQAARQVAELVDRIVTVREIDRQMQRLVEQLRTAPLESQRALATRLFELRRLRSRH